MSNITSLLTGGKSEETEGIRQDDSVAVAASNELLNTMEGGSQSLAVRGRGRSAFLRSNTRHKFADVALALAAYAFSGFIHMYGQGTALTTLSLWAAGTTFLLNMQVRKVFEFEDVSKRQHATAGMGYKESNVFQLEAVASWVWMLSSLQQFKVHRRLKYCGYSSWSALCCCTYFTFRHMYQVLLSE